MGSDHRGKERVKYLTMNKLDKLWLRQGLITVCMCMRATREKIFLSGIRRNREEIRWNQTKENNEWIIGIVLNGKLDQSFQKYLYKLVRTKHSDVRKLLESQLLQILASSISCSRARNKNNQLQTQWKGFGCLCFLVQETNDSRKFCQRARY